MEARVTIDGFAQMRALLQKLPPAAQARVVRPAMRAGARYIARQIKMATPIGSRGNLRRGAGFVRQSRSASQWGVAFRIGYRARIASHALIVDQGTAARYTKSGAYRGRMPSARFFDNAVAGAQRVAMIMLRDRWARGLATEARRFRSGQLDARGRIRPQFRSSRRRP